MIDAALQEEIDDKICEYLGHQIFKARRKLAEEPLISYHEAQRKKKMKYQISGVSCECWEPESDFR